MSGDVDFDRFLDDAWNEHGERPREVAERLAASVAIVAAPSQVAPYARIVAHVYGEHLGECDRGIALLDALRGVPGCAGSAEAAAAIARNIAVLRHVGGDDGALAGLGDEERIAALAAASSALAGRHAFGRAIAAYTQALAAAAPGLSAGSPALRALAVGGNNLAASLEEKPDRDTAETAAMVAAAEAGLTYWTLAGTWLEEERAEYRLARSLLQAGQAQRAAAAALRCIAVCEAHDAPPFERFFGYAALAMARRAAGEGAAFEAARRAARELHAQVPEGERGWCAGDLALLD